MITSSRLSQDWEKEEIKNMFESRTRCDWDRVEIKFTSSRKQEQDPEWYWDKVEFEIETLSSRKQVKNNPRTNQDRVEIKKI